MKFFFTENIFSDSIQFFMSHLKECVFFALYFILKILFRFPIFFLISFICINFWITLTTNCTVLLYLTGFPSFSLNRFLITIVYHYFQFLNYITLSFMHSILPTHNSSLPTVRSMIGFI